MRLPTSTIRIASIALAATALLASGCFQVENRAQRRAALELDDGDAIDGPGKGPGDKDPPPLIVPKEPKFVPSAGKLTVAIADIPNVKIELPDESIQDFGKDLQARLTTQLTESGGYIVTDENLARGKKNRLGALAMGDYFWQGSVTPAATIRIKTEELSFVTGDRGGRMYYGFNRRFRTPFNDGTMREKNEFPLRSVTFEPNWFDREFDGKGSDLFGSHSGLDLGEGFELDVLFAYFRIKYARYETRVGLQVEIDAPIAGRREIRRIDVKGQGYFYDVVGGYLQYSGGIRVARANAMDQALQHAFDGSFQAIAKGLVDLPLLARVDETLSEEGLVLLGTGAFSEVKPGIVFVGVDRPDLQLEIVRSVASGSVAKMRHGEIASLVPGMRFRQAIGAQPPVHVGALAQANALARDDIGTPTQSQESVELPWVNLPRSDLERWVPEISKWEAAGRSIVGVATLAYRAWRYFRYDQEFKFGELSEDDLEQDPAYEEGDNEGDQQLNAAGSSDLSEGQEWARQIGLDRAPRMPALGEDAPIVAVIDSGVDYNHRLLRSQIWWRPGPDSDSPGIEPGYDFISGDPRPYDDGYTGTQVASAVLAVAPAARILPIKAFNPWGVTSSAALASAFRYAVDQGAKVIVCGWATRLNSKAIQEGVAYARSRNVIVVAAAGDRGTSLMDHRAYPASFAETQDHVLAVGSVDSQNRLVSESGRKSSFGVRIVGIAAPGLKIRVAEPRNRRVKATGTGIAAGLVAGALARQIAWLGGATATPSQLIRELQAEAEAIPELAGSVRNGYRLKIVR